MSPLAQTSFSQARTRKAVERAAYLQHHINRSLAELDAIKASFKAQGDGDYLGTGHRITVTTSQATRLDSGLVKAALSPGQIVACSTTSEVTRVLIKEI